MSSSGNIEELLRGLKRSKGRFSPFLARYSYVSQRDRLIENFRASFPGVLKVLALDESVTQIYTTVRGYLEDKELDVLMVYGWESLRDINKLLVGMGYVREEFRKHCPLPIVFWVDGKVCRKFIRLIPDFYNWVSLTVFESANDELIDFIQQTSESVYQKVLESGVGIFLDYTDLGLPESTYQDLLEARQELGNRGITLEAELEASLEFVLGRLADDFEETARDHYQRSLELWEQLNNLLRVAHTYYYLGLWWQSYGVTHRVEKNRAYKHAGSHFKRSVEGFEAINRLDLVAKFINGWGEVLQILESWDELETVANRAIEVLDTSQPSFRLARAYDFLAECELAKGNYRQGKKLAETAIEIFDNTLSAAAVPTLEKDKKTLDREEYYHRGRYLFSLAKAEQGNGKIKSAIATLEKAKKRTNPEYNPDFYIKIIKELGEIYYGQEEYLKAFELKQERQRIEQQFGFIAFIGANTLGSRKANMNLALPQLKPKNNQEKTTQEIAASGREFDVKILLERLSRPDHKLIVIYGESGVGKSSILQAGLIPVLEKKSIDTRDVVVVLRRVYVNWISQLGKGLAKQLEKTKNLAVNSEALTSIEGIFAQLKKNEKSNLLTVIIFDQFEEFFFVNREPRHRREFAQFLQYCLEIPFVTIVLSLREDYIHYLPYFSRLANLEVINENILDKNILYYLGNFTPSKAKLVIEELTANSQFKIDSELTEKLVEDLAEELGEVRPIELQIVGAQLQAEKITILGKYQELGNNPKVELVDKYLESVVQDCGKENEEFAWVVLWLLTDENNTRPLKTKAELVKESPFNLEKLELVLKIFVGSGLVFLLPEKPAVLYQLVHDYLVWFIRQRKGNKIQEELKQEQEKRQQEREKRQQEWEKRQQLQKWVIIGFVPVVMVVVGGIGMFARVAHKNSIISQANKSRALSLSGQQWGGLMTAMKVRQKQIDAKIKPIGEASKITNALQVAVYRRKKDDEFREINRIQGHDSSVEAVAYSPDGETIATASRDKTVKLWNRQGKLLQTLTGHDSSVEAVAYSPDGETIATAGDDNTVKLWNRQGKLLQTLTDHENSVWGIAFSPDGETIASASRDKTVKLWNRQGKLLQTLTDHENWVYGIAFSPDGETIATAGADKTVKLWNRQGKLLQTLTGHENSVYGIAFSPDGETIATASGDNTVKLWNRQGKLLQTLTDHNNSVEAVAFSSDGETIATAGADKTVKLWNRQGKLLQTLIGHWSPVIGIAFSPDGETIASASWGQTVKLWRRQGNLLQTLTGHENSVNAIAFSPDGKTIATASADKTVKLWNRQGKLLQTLTGHENWVYRIAFSPDGETIASAGGDKTVKLWNRQGKLLQTLSDHEYSVYGMAFSPDGETIATTGDDKTVKLWSRQGKLLQTLSDHEYSVICIAFSSDGETIATAGDDKTVKLWNRQGKLLQTITGHEYSVYNISFSPDGETIASASGDKTVKLWNLQGKLLQTLTGHEYSVYDISFSPDGETIATASGDKTVKLWNRQGKLLQTITGYEDSINDVAFSPDGKIIATAGADKTVKLWRNLPIEDLTKRGCEWLNDYLITHPQELEELKICQTDKRKELAASSWVIEGEKLAREGNVKDAVGRFKKALKWNPDLNLDSKLAAASLAEAETLMEEGTKLAREGKIEAAVRKYKRAKELDQVAFIPTLQNLEPEVEATYQAVPALLKKGDDLVKEGKVKEAIASYQKVEKIDPTQISASHWNELCRYGSLSQKAADVMFACDKAVSLSRKDGDIIDSRGLARALTGDIEGAIADFQVFVEWTSNKKRKAQRQEWIKALQAGENPFTDELLKELK